MEALVVFRVRLESVWVVRRANDVAACALVVADF